MAGRAQSPQRRAANVDARGSNRNGSWSLQRIYLAFVVGVAVLLSLLGFSQWTNLSALLPNHELHDEAQDLEVLQSQRQLVWRNCIGLELLRLTDMCVEAYEFEHPQQRNVVNPMRGVLPTFEHDANWLSQYGLVLDYGIGYAPPAPPSPRFWQRKPSDKPPTLRPHLSSYAPPPDSIPYRPTIKRTLKCVLPPTGSGFTSTPTHGMSIVWEILYRPPPLVASHVGVYGANMSYSNRTHPSHPLSCPGEEDPELEVVFNIWINCAKDIKREFLGNPLDDNDFKIRRKCFEAAWLWAKWVGIDVIGLETWSDMCTLKAKTEKRKRQASGPGRKGAAKRGQRPPKRPTAHPSLPKPGETTPGKDGPDDRVRRQEGNLLHTDGAAEQQHNEDENAPASDENEDGEELAYDLEEDYDSEIKYEDEELLECEGRNWHMEYGWKKIEVT